MMKDKIWHLLSRKLTNEASEEEIQELEQLLSENPQLREDIVRFTSFWERDPVTDREYLEATYYLHCSRMEKQGIDFPSTDDHAVTEEGSFTVKHRFSAKLFLGSVVVLLIIVSGAMVYFQDKVKEKQFISGENVSDQQEVAKNGWSEGKKTVITKNGQNEKFKLPDGTQVWLNAGSRIEYGSMKGNGNREVVLTGEAFFDVVKDAKRPFIIHTAKVDVRVLGTKFNLKAYPQDKTIETSLVQGSVEVFVKDRPGEKFLLKPNQKLVLLNNNDEQVSLQEPVSARNSANLPIIAIKRLSYSKLGDSTIPLETSWLQKKLLFENEAFSEVARKMERWYDVEIHFMNQYLRDEVLNGDFRNESLNQALDALRFTTDFNYKIEGRKIIIY